jgi:hypothetical protein
MGEPKSRSQLERQTPTGRDKAIGSNQADALLIPGEYERHPAPREETHERGRDGNGTESSPDTHG